MPAKSICEVVESESGKQFTITYKTIPERTRLLAVLEACYSINNWALLTDIQESINYRQTLEQRPPNCHQPFLRYSQHNRTTAWRCNCPGCI